MEGRGSGSSSSSKVHTLLRRFAAHHMQTTLQLAVGQALCFLLVFIRPITFPLACLAGVFLVVLHLLLVRDHHVGTLLLSAAGLLGAVWSGIAAAGILVSISLQIPSRAGHLVFTAVLACAGFALVSCVRVSNQPFRVTLQAINLLMTFGMSVVLSLWAPTTAFLWRYFLAHMLLSFLAAALASFLAGLLVLPSLATEAAMQAVITALQKTGQTGTLCVSILLRPQQQHGGPLPGATSSLEQHFQWQQQLAGRMSVTSVGASTAGSLTARSAFSEAAEATGDADGQARSGSSATPAAAIIDANADHMQQQQQHYLQNTASVGPGTAPASQLQQQLSLLEEVPEFASHPSLELDRMAALSQPGHWGLRSFVVAAASSSSQASQQQQQQQQQLVLDSEAVPHQLQQQQEEGMKQQGPAARPDAAAAAAAIAAAATVPGAEEQAESEAATGEQQDDAALQDGSGSVSSWRDQHKSHLLQRLHLLPSQHPHRQQQRESSASHLQQSTSGHALKQPQQLGFASGLQQQAARHLFMRLGRGVDHIRPLLAEARLLREAVAVEQAGWLRMLTTGPAWQPWPLAGAAQGRRFGGAGALPIVSWMRLVDALQALLERVAALEGMLEPGPDTKSLASLASYPTLRSTCGIVFAQTAALCAGLSTALQQRLEQRQRTQQGPLVWLARSAAALFTCRCFQTTETPSSADHADSMLLGVCWGAAKQQLLAVLHCETQQYWEDLAAAGPGKPFKLDPAAGIVSLMFFCTLTLAVIEAGQELQEAGQAVLYGSGGAGAAAEAAAAAAGARKVKAARQLGAEPAAAPAGEHEEEIELAAAQAGQHGAVPASNSSIAAAAASSSDFARPAAIAVAAAPGEQDADNSALRTAAAVHASPLSAVVVHSVPHRTTAGHQHSHDTAHTSPTHTPAAAAVQQQQQPSSVWSRLKRPLSNKAAAAPGPSAGAALSSSSLLLEVLLCAAIWRRLARALLQELPAALKSKHGLRALLSQRRFKAGVKVWLACTVALAAAVVVAVVLPGLSPSVVMFGFLALVFSMRERVESSAEMVIMRVAMTVVGACIGHALMFHPATAYKPAPLAIILLLITFVAAPFTAGQYKLMLTLLVITCNSMVLCQYTGCCGGVGSVTYFVGRILATGGGCLFAMMLNRLLWPWYRNRWVLEELSEVLTLGVAAAAGMYSSEYARVAALAGHRNCGNSSRHGSAAAAGGSNSVAAAYSAPTLVTATTAGSGSAHSTHDAVIHILSPAAVSGTTQQHQQQEKQQAAGLTDAQQLLLQQPAKVLLGRMMGALVPVEFAVQRDTWLAWRRGSLAVAPVVRVMLGAVQQLTDALAALRVTLELSQQQQQQQQQQQPNGLHLPIATDEAAAQPLGHSQPGQPSQLEFDPGWHSSLLFDQLAALVHADISGVLTQLQQLAGLVVEVVRQPGSKELQLQLREEVAAIHKLRLALSIKYVSLRNQRHRRVRQLMRQQQQQQDQPLPAAPSTDHASHVSQAAEIPKPDEQQELRMPRHSNSDAVRSPHHSSRHHPHHHHHQQQQQLPGSAANPGLMALAAAAEGVVEASARAHMAAAHSSSTSGAGAAADDAGGSRRQGSGQQALPEAGPRHSAVEGEAAGQQQQQQSVVPPTSAESDLATLQYMAFVYALRRVINRALAVARCLVDE